MHSIRVVGAAVVMIVAVGCGSSLKSVEVSDGTCDGTGGRGDTVTITAHVNVSNTDQSQGNSQTVSFKVTRAGLDVTSQLLGNSTTCRIPAQSGSNGVCSVQFHTSLPGTYVVEGSMGSGTNATSASGQMLICEHDFCSCSCSNPTTDGTYLTDANNCGACGHACPGGAGTCVAGVCVARKEEDLASLTVVGPTTLQGSQPWTCTPGTVSGNVCEHPDPSCSTKATPCPIEMNQMPSWTAGNAFTIASAAQTPFSRIWVTNGAVNLNANIKFQDDTSVTDVSIDSDGAANASPCTNASDCEAGVCPSDHFCPPFQCHDSLMPGAVEGNHGHYVVVVQQWDTTGGACGSQGRPLVEPPPDSLTISPEFPPVNNDTPAPPGSQTGCWVDVPGATGRADLFGSTGPAGALRAAANSAVNSKITIPFNMKGVSAFIRYVVTVTEGDTRVTSSNPVSNWANGAKTINGTYCPDTPGRPGQWAWHDYYQWHITNPPGSLSVQQATTPVQLAVEPTALAQLKALPFTILYAPPGNTSKANFQISNTFATTMSFTGTGATGSSKNVDNKSQTTESLGISSSGATGILGLNQALQNANIGSSLMNSSTWDTSTLVGIGSSSAAASSSTGTFSLTQTWASQSPSNVPGANGTYGQEPFWGDQFVLLYHPQVGFWQIDGQPVVSLLSALGGPTGPFWIQPMVFELASCAGLPGPSGTVDATFASGWPMPGTDVGHGADKLTPEECRSLLALDPFYGVGQNKPSFLNPVQLSVHGAQQDPRASYVTNVVYGTTMAGETGQQVTQTYAQANMMSATKVATFNGNVQDILTSSQTQGVSFSMWGVSGSIQQMDTETETNGATWNVQYQQSFSATATTSTQVQVSFDHRAVLPYRPTANIYQDTIFGSYMFQDPTAPGAP